LFPAVHAILTMHASGRLQGDHDNSARYDKCAAESSVSWFPDRSGLCRVSHCSMADSQRQAPCIEQLETELRDAIELEGLSLSYQPQYDIRTGRVCGVEALARLIRGAGDSIAPTVFIALAERAGLICLLGEWALRNGCKTAAQWLAAGVPTPTISINVSPRQICGQFTAEIARALELSGLPGECLELEITENVLLSNTEMALKCMAQWKRLGVRIALDDFGAGYSNLAYLSKLPIDRLKIDGSLIRTMTGGSPDTAIVRTVIALAVNLGITVLAECVETEEQLAMLDEFGCQQAQGYLLTPPASAVHARALMSQRWGARLAGSRPFVVPSEGSGSQFQLHSMWTVLPQDEGAAHGARNG
jgi:EAL domain-containing protein (putative c-di-GMP-specific phosphodiesterase class I)